MKVIVTTNDDRQFALSSEEISNFTEIHPEFEDIDLSTFQAAVSGDMFILLTELDKKFKVDNCIAVLPDSAQKVWDILDAAYVLGLNWLVLQIITNTMDTVRRLQTPVAIRKHYGIENTLSVENKNAIEKELAMLTDKK